MKILFLVYAECIVAVQRTNDVAIFLANLYGFCRNSDAIANTATSIYFSNTT